MLSRDVGPVLDQRLRSVSARPVGGSRIDRSNHQEPDPAEAACL